MLKLKIYIVVIISILPNTYYSYAQGLYKKSEISFNLTVIHNPNNPLSINAIGDLNNDGLNDIAVSGIDSILIYYQNPQNQLDTVFAIDATTQTPFGGLSAIDIGDLNGDGLDDLIFARSDSICIHFQNLDGSLNNRINYYSGRGIDACKVGDLNNDGLNDIALSHHHFEYQYIRVFYQGINGNFDSSVTYSDAGGFHEMVLNDVNNDNLTDLILKSGFGSYQYDLTIFIQDTSGNLIPPILFDFNTPVDGVAVGDLNGDYRNDIVITFSFGYYFGVLYQDSLGNISQSPTMIQASRNNPSPVEIGDFDLDGKNEVAIVHDGWNSLSIYKQNDNGELTAYDIITIPYSSQYPEEGLQIADINNDNLPDIVIGDLNNLLVLYNTSQVTTNTFKNNEFSTDNSIVLEQNSPNPFNPVTCIEYTIPKSNQVTLSIFDINGKNVKTLINEYQKNGKYSINFYNDHLSSGIYFYQLKVGNKFLETKKMIILQ